MPVRLNLSPLPHSERISFQKKKKIENCYPEQTLALLCMLKKKKKCFSECHLIVTSCEPQEAAIILLVFLFFFSETMMLVGSRVPELLALFSHSGLPYLPQVKLMYW